MGARSKMNEGIGGGGGEKVGFVDVIRKKDEGVQDRTTRD